MPREKVQPSFSTVMLEYAPDVDPSRYTLPDVDALIAKVPPDTLATAAANRHATSLSDTLAY